MRRPPPAPTTTRRPGYAITHLLEPESPRLLSRTARAMSGAALLLTGAAAALPGGDGPTSVPTADSPERAVHIPDGEWIRLFGQPDPAPPPPPGWSLESWTPPVLPTAFAPLSHQEGPTDVTRPLADVLDAIRRSATPYRLAREGGEIRPYSAYASPWQWASLATVSPPPTPFVVTLPPAVDPRLYRAGLSQWIDGVNYTDPLNTGLPLLHVRGFEDTPVSKHFTVRDFATRDGAPLARIAVDLIAGLERMRTLVGPLHVISGYRHPHYNARRSVGGARYSRHQTGQAADVWSPTVTSVELARSAVHAMGCGIGLGLGENTIHVDVRGYLTTWTYEGAPLSRSTFDQWIRDLCGGAAAPPPPLRPHLDWLTIVDDGNADTEEVVHLAPPPEEAEVAPAPTPSLPLAERIRRDLAGVMEAEAGGHALPVAVVDLRDGVSPHEADLSARSRLIRPASPEALHLGVRPLLEWVAGRPAGTYFVYAVRFPEGRVETGVAPTSAVPAAPPRSARPPAASGDGRWLVTVTSRTSLAGAEADLDRYGQELRSAGFQPALRVRHTPAGIRYDVVIGPFPDEDAATAATRRLAPDLPVPPEVVRVTTTVDMGSSRAVSRDPAS